MASGSEDYTTDVIKGYNMHKLALTSFINIARCFLQDKIAVMRAVNSITNVGTDRGILLNGAACMASAHKACLPMIVGDTIPQTSVAFLVSHIAKL